MLYIVSFASMVQKPDRSRITFCAHLRQGISVPSRQNHGLFLYDSLIWIYFVVVSQNKRNRSRKRSVPFFFASTDSNPKGSPTARKYSRCTSLVNLTPSSPYFLRARREKQFSTVFPSLTFRPCKKIDKFRQKLVDFYFFTLTSSLFTLLL